MDNEIKHTPTPWSVKNGGLVFDIGSGIKYWYIDGGAENVSVPVCNLHLKNGEANAKHIVKCVNENESLHARIKELEDVVENLGELSNTCTRNYTGKICSTCKCPKAKEVNDDK